MSGTPIKKGTIVWEHQNVTSRIDYDGFTTASLIRQSIRLFSDGRLVYANDESSSFEANPILSLLTISVKYLPVGEEGKNATRCLVIDCETNSQTHQKAQLRIIDNEKNLEELLKVLKTVAKEHNIDSAFTEKKSDKGSTRSILFDQPNIMFTALRERKYLFSLMWKKWAPRTVKVYSDGTLTYTHPYMTEAPLHHTLKLQNIEVTLLTDAALQAGAEESSFGLNIKCQTLRGIDTYIRCILANKQILDELLFAMKTVATTHNIDHLQRASLNVDQHRPTLSVWAGMPKSSAMRRAVCRSIDYHHKKSLVEQIVNKRGVFKWLPVIGSNDLIHGSWWFVIGSLGVVGTAAVMVVNRYTTLLSEDYSTLSTTDFAATWILMSISGFFSTLGSLAFVRAFHEDPPMTPLFTWYHLQSDELLASWLFFCATVPFVPYCLIFLQSDGFNSLLFLAALGFSIVACLGTLLFVRACYPSDRTYKHLILPISNYLCCFRCQNWREKHFVNDWLGGSWFFLWGSGLVTFFSGIALIVVWATHDAILTFMYGTSFIECVAFTIGSAYFVAGSYPEVPHSTSEQDLPDIEINLPMSQQQQKKILTDDHIDDSGL